MKTGKTNSVHTRAVQNAVLGIAFMLAAGACPAQMMPPSSLKGTLSVTFSASPPAYCGPPPNVCTMSTWMQASVPETPIVFNYSGGAGGSGSLIYAGFWLSPALVSGTDQSLWTAPVPTPPGTDCLDVYTPRIDGTITGQVDGITLYLDPTNLTGYFTFTASGSRTWIETFASLHSGCPPPYTVTYVDPWGEGFPGPFPCTVSKNGDQLTVNVSANILWPNVPLGDGPYDENNYITLSGQLIGGPGTNVVVIALPNPTDAGTVAGGGVYPRGSLVTVAASPNPGYQFANWTEDGSILSLSTSYSLVATDDVALVANFTTNNYTVAVSPSPPDGGTVSGGGTYMAGTLATVTATANPDYEFVNWTESDNVVSSSAAYSFTVDRDVSLVANFTNKSYTVTVSPAPPVGGTVAGGGIYPANSLATVTATANPGFQFANWTEDGSIVYSFASYPFVATGDRSLVANFTTNSYTVTVLPNTGGTVSGGGTYPAGSLATVCATAITGFGFLNWTKDGAVVSTSRCYSFPVDGDISLVANFLPRNYKLSVSPSPTSAGVVGIDGIYGASGAALTNIFGYGFAVTVNASPNSGYKFVDWTQKGVVVSSSPSYGFIIEGNVQLVANFASTNSIIYTVTAVSSPSQGGTVTGTGAYLSGSTATLAASPNPGYQFVDWTQNGSVVSSSTNYSFKVAQSLTLTANFAPLNYTVTVGVSPQDGGSTGGSGVYPSGGLATVSATPNSGYQFVNWTENGASVSSSSPYTFTVTRDATLTANFAPANSSIDAVDLGVSPSQGGTVTGAGPYASGSFATVTATPNQGYQFVNWTQDGKAVSWFGSYTFPVTSNTTVVANFTSITVPVLNPAAYAYHLEIRFAGYNRSETLSNFPALVQIGTNLPGFSYAQLASPSGGDLRFTDSSGTRQIPYEIDEWRPEGVSSIWVQVPALATETDTIYMYWGNPLDPTPLDWTTNGEVWVPLSGTAPFEVVYHLKEVSLPFTDSTQQHPALAGLAPIATPGVVGTAGLFSGGSYLNSGVVDLGDAFTLSAWVNIDATATNIQTLWANQHGGFASPGFALFVNTYGQSDQKLDLASGDGNVGNEAITAPGTVSFGQWHLISAAVDRKAGIVRFFLDGNPAAVANSDLAVPGLANDADLFLGAFTNDAFNLHAALDEARIQHGTNSLAWAWASYMTVAQNGTFQNYSAITSPPLVLTTRSSAQTLTLTWPRGTLQSAAQANGPYSNVLNALPPWPIPINDPQHFYRVVQ